MTDENGQVARIIINGPGQAIFGWHADELRDAYQVPDVDTKATIALVIAYHYPGADADLSNYRAEFNLPPCRTATGCLKIVNKDGQASPLPGLQPPNLPPPLNKDWTAEAALDLDMASAGCPSCNLVLVEADDVDRDHLFVAQIGAVKAGAQVVSNSWGGNEDGLTTTLGYEKYFDHPGVTFFAGTGDAGYADSENTSRTPYYPATSAHVVAVGGTMLTRDPNVPRGWSESVGPSAGSGCSGFIPKPAWQTTNTCAMRSIADVSAVSGYERESNVAVYHKGGWVQMGGTSAATPLVAAIFAATGHAGASPSYVYEHAGAFFDVTTGTNGSCGNAQCIAGVGWDGPTGLGSPNAGRLVPCGAQSELCCGGTECHVGLTCGPTKRCVCDCTAECVDCNPSLGKTGGCAMCQACKAGGCGGSCDHVGDACCAGGECGGTLTCVSGKCATKPPPCGKQGIACCNGSCDAGLVCNGSTCDACGASGEACCAANTCDPGFSCAGQKCVTVGPICGRVGEACCAEGKCNSSAIPCVNKKCACPPDCAGACSSCDPQKRPGPCKICEACKLNGCSTGGE